MMAYGSLNTFFGGLEGLIGSPSPKVEAVMAQEHTERGDSDKVFTTANYELTSTSRKEYAFVATPDRPPGGAFPVEEKIHRMRSTAGQMRPSLAALAASGVQPRAAIARKDLAAKLREPNGALAKAMEPPVLIEEAIGARLYTGPLFVKCATLLLEPPKPKRRAEGPH
jgi:NLR family CARD domain-containing protein 3